MNAALEEMLRLVLSRTEFETAGRGRQTDFKITHEEGRPGAQVSGRLRPDLMQIDSSYVPASQQGQGLGRDMYMRALAEAQGQGRHLASDRTVSNQAENVYQGMANNGVPVYSGADMPVTVDQTINPDGTYDNFIYNQNSMGGPVFAIPNEELGGLSDLLFKYMKADPANPQHQEMISQVASTYVRMKVESKSPIPETDEEILSDPILTSVLAALGLGGATAAVASTQGDPEMMALLD